ncbi:MAG: DUF2267 domain-containing protein [Chloroflexaceae bacterium]|jgi:hypothetical protein|nr:DUF2267 domain-containing protein [Chloroflexaceae bacterium]
MEQLVQLVQQKTGMSAEQAQTAVTTVIGFLKEKLPAPVAGQIDGVMGMAGGAAGASDMMNQAKGMLGGLMGGDKK